MVLPRKAWRAKVTCYCGPRSSGVRLRRKPSRRLQVPSPCSRGGGRRGLPGPLPLPRAVQCLTSPAGSSAPSSGPDGFRNRVAAVSALSQPHLCRPALGSPAALRSQAGKPTLEGPTPEPPTRRSCTPRCRSAAGETAAGETRARVPRLCFGAEAHRMLGVGEEGGQGRPDAGSVGEGVRSPRHSLRPLHRSCAAQARAAVESRAGRDWGVGVLGVGRGEARGGEVLLETHRTPWWRGPDRASPVGSWKG